LVAALVVLIAMYIAMYTVVLRKSPIPNWLRARMSASARVRPERPGGPYPTEYDEVKVTIEIPPLSEFPSTWTEVEGAVEGVEDGLLLPWAARVPGFHVVGDADLGAAEADL